MPNGFRGDAVYKYLDRVERSLEIAIEVHSRDLLRGAPIARTGRPSLPLQVNEKVPYHAETAFTGEWARARGQSSNIVVDEKEYMECSYWIENEIEQEAHIEFKQLVRAFETLSETNFSLPHTRYRLKFYLSSLESMFPESSRLTNKYNAEMRNYVQKILVDGKAFFVWNQQAAARVRDENEKAMENQESNMSRTVNGCHRTIESLQIRWNERDHVANTAMKSVSDGNGGSKLVEDTFRRQEARLDADEIQAQMNGINRAIIELNQTVWELQIARSEANRFFETTEQRTLDIDRQYQNKIRDIGYEVFNLKNKIIQAENDLNSVFSSGDSFDKRPDFLSWLYENHPLVYLDVLRREAERIFAQFFTTDNWDLGERWLNLHVLEDFMRRTGEFANVEFTNADFWALAMVFTELERHEDIERFLQLTARQVGIREDAIEWEICSHRVGGILQFLDLDMHRQHERILNPCAERPLSQGDYANFVRLFERTQLLSFVGSLNNYEFTHHEEQGDGVSVMETRISGSLLSDRGADGPFLTFEPSSGDVADSRLTIRKEQTTFMVWGGEFGGGNELNFKGNRDIGFEISRPMVSTDLTDRVSNIAWDDYKTTLGPNLEAEAARTLLDGVGAAIGMAYPKAGMAIAVLSAGGGFVSEIQQTEVRRENANALRGDLNEANMMNTFGMMGVLIQDDFGGNQLILGATSATQPAIDAFNFVLERDDLTIGAEELSRIEQGDLFNDPAAIVKVIFHHEDGNGEYRGRRQMVYRAAQDVIGNYEPHRTKYEGNVRL